MADPVEKNSYDKADNVRQVGLIRANGMKLAAYKVRDLETGEFGSVQFHMTHENTVMAVMSEEAAKLFAMFVEMTVGSKKNGPLHSVQEIKYEIGQGLGPIGPVEVHDPRTYGVRLDESITRGTVDMSRMLRNGEHPV